MSSLTDRMLKSTSIKSSAVLSKSKIKKTVTQTSIPIMNVAFSGALDGGLESGLTVFAGPSKHFKTNFSLVAVSAYLKANKDAICLFYDSEFGAGAAYFNSMGINSSRVIHIPIMNVEEFKFDLVEKLEELTDKDDVIIFVDSIGNLASNKEVEDAKDKKSVTDMTRAKAIKSLFRMVTPYLTLKDIPMVVVAHTYMEQKMYGKAVVSGGTGIIYSANSIYVVGRRQDKDGKELLGYEFILRVEKSRLVKEGSQIPVTVSFDAGISKWSGLLDVALELGYVFKPKQGWYTNVESDDAKKYREKDTNTAEFWKPVLSNTQFHQAIKDKYQIAQIDMLESEDA